MDLKKEIKLSDLVPKRKAAPGKERRTVKRPRTGVSEIVGLKIGATGIRAAHVVNNGGTELVRMAHAPLSSGVVDGGEVRDPSALGKALDDFFADNALPRKG